MESWADDCSQDPGLVRTNPQLNSAICKALDEVFHDFATSCSLTFPIHLTKNSDLGKSPERNMKTVNISAVPKLLLGTDLKRILV